MRFIELDARKWRTVSDLYDALFIGIEAPTWHSRNLNALVDAMIFERIGVNAIDPPYTIRIVGTVALSSELKKEIEFTADAIRKVRRTDAYVEFEIAP